MNALRSPSLRQRFLVAPLLGLVLLGVLTAAFAYEMWRQNALLTRVIDENLIAFERYADISNEMSAQHVGLFDLLNSAPQSDEETLYDNAKQRLLAIQDATRKLREAMPAADSGNAAAIARRGETLALIEAYRRAAIAAVEMTTLNVALAPREITLANQRFDAMNRAFEKLLDDELGEITRQVGARVGLNHARTAVLALGGMLLAVLLLALSVGLSRLLASSLEEQIRQLVELGGPAQADMQAGGGDEVARLGRGIAAFRRTQLELRESEERYRQLVELSPDAILIHREDKIIFANSACLKLLGATRASDLIAGSAIGLVHPDSREMVLARRHQVAETRRPVSLYETRLVRVDGSAIDVEAAAGPLAQDGGLDIQIVLRDITARKAADEKIRRLNRVYSVLSGINTLIVRVKDRQELFREACRIAAEHGGFGMAWIGLLDPDTLDVVPAAWAGVEGDPGWADLTATARDTTRGRGSIGRAIRQIEPVIVNDMTREPAVGGARRKRAIELGFRSVIALPLVVEGKAVGTFTLFAKEPGFFDEEEVKLLIELAGDISFALDHIGKREKLDYLAFYDELTGLPNRALIQERLALQLRAAQQRGGKVALFLGDVKRFRFINESLGRHAGDRLLREIAARARSVWPEPENLARLTADTFVGIQADLKDEAEVAHVLERALAGLIGSPFRIDDKELSISMTAGIAIFPADGGDADTLFRNAEAALKQAKKAGEPYLFYQPGMNARVADTLLLENKLRRALEKEQFVLHYQPKLDRATGAICGLEALIRWNDPETGLVPPVKFIPLLEETGMILEVGRWAIKRALAEYSEWCASGLRAPRIAVNVSPIQLRQKDFVDVVRNAIGQSAGCDHGLDLEITESLVMEDIEGNIGKLKAIRDMGVNIAIDDFGTGYSSLGYLAKLPVTTLKIDRSFIITMAKAPDSMTIVSTIISLAHALNLKVVAEGVDSEEQRSILLSLECDEMQGYLFSKPLPAADIEALLRSEGVGTFPAARLPAPAPVP